MTDYKQRASDYSEWPRFRVKDLAQILYTEHDYGIKELETEFERTMTTYYLPEWIKTDRAELIRARKQRVIKNRRALARKAKKKPVKLNKAEKVKVKAMSNKIRKFDIKSVKINIKQCPVNLWLMGGL